MTPRPWEEGKPPGSFHAVDGCFTTTEQQAEGKSPQVFAGPDAVHTTVVGSAEMHLGPSSYESGLRGQPAWPGVHSGEQ